jgi:lysophospholipase L1-like esterase
MRIPDDKKVGYLLVSSIIFNLIFFGYSIRKIYWKYQQYKTEQFFELKKINKSPARNITYFVGRNEVFINLPNDTNEIIMLGNSHTQNFEWHEIFKNINIKNRGINGDITYGILQRLDEIIESKPKKIFIEIGINDLLQGYHIDTIMYNYYKIIQQIRIKSPKTLIYIQNILPTNLTIYEKPSVESVYVINQKLRTYCTTYNLTYIDLFSKFFKNGGLNPKFDCGDNLHLNSSGYRVWCNSIKDYIYE